MSIPVVVKQVFSSKINTQTPPSSNVHNSISCFLSRKLIEWEQFRLFIQADVIDSIITVKTNEYYTGMITLVHKPQLCTLLKRPNIYTPLDVLSISDVNYSLCTQNFNYKQISLHKFVNI